MCHLFISKSTVIVVFHPLLIQFILFSITYNNFNSTIINLCLIIFHCTINIRGPFIDFYLNFLDNFCSFNFTITSSTNYIFTVLLYTYPLVSSDSAYLLCIIFSLCLDNHYCDLQLPYLRH